MPIYNSDKKIIGVTELINKVNGNPFNESDANTIEVSMSIMRVLRPTHLMKYCRQIFLLFASLSLAVFIPLLCGCWWSFTKVCFYGVIREAIY